MTGQGFRVQPAGFKVQRSGFRERQHGPGRQALEDSLLRAPLPPVRTSRLQQEFAPAPPPEPRTLNPQPCPSRCPSLPRPPSLSPPPCPRPLASARQSALLRLSAEIAAALEEEDVCQRVVDGLHDESLGYNLIGLFLLDEHTGERVLRACVGWDRREGRDAHRRRPRAHRAGAARPEALLHGRRRRRRRTTSPPSPAAAKWTSRSSSRASRSACSCVESHDVDAFGKPDFEILTAAANQASIAIARARLLVNERRRADEQQALLDSMSDLASALELPQGAAGGAQARRDAARRHRRARSRSTTRRRARLEIVASEIIGKDSIGTRLRLRRRGDGHRRADARADDHPQLPRVAGRAELVRRSRTSTR